ncbi:MAG: MBL fold metallo-hydrolase [Deferribacterales bacterium]
MLYLLGTRGTLPVSGQRFVKYGGNTTCLMTPIDERSCIIFDGGTGIMSLNKYNNFEEYHIFLTHLHWDHIVGVPIFQAFYNHKKKIHIYLENKPSLQSTDILEVLFNPPFFPVPRNKLRAEISMNLIDTGDQFSFPGIDIHAAEGNHPDGVMMYKIIYPDKSVLFTSDYEHGTPVDDFLIEFACGCDYLIYDTTYHPDEYAGKSGMSRVGWGHSTYQQGIEFVKKANVKNLVLTHHNPDYDDITLDEMGIMARRQFANTFVAYDGMVI